MVAASFSTSSPAIERDISLPPLITVRLGAPAQQSETGIIRAPHPGLSSCSPFRDMPLTLPERGEATLAYGLSGLSRRWSAGATLRRLAQIARRAIPLVAVLILAGCGSSGPPSSDAVDATSFFRAQAAAHYHGTTATNDGRGCAKVTSTRFDCTAYVRDPHEPNRDIDVYGVVTIHPSGMEVQAHLARGREIQNWFADTLGGCKTASCKGTVMTKPYHGPVTVGTVTIPASS